ALHADPTGADRGAGGRPSRRRRAARRRAGRPAHHHARRGARRCRRRRAGAGGEPHDPQGPGRPRARREHGRGGLLMRLALLLAVVLGGCFHRRPMPPPPSPDIAYGRPTVPPTGSLWHPELAANYAFQDVRAHFPGDLLTVTIAEQSAGKKNATTDTSAESSI